MKPTSGRVATALAAALLCSLAVIAGAVAPPDGRASIRFTDVTAAAGLHFRHNSGAFGKKYLPETLGSGCAFLDVDNDGWQDLLLINSMDWPGHKRTRSYPAL